MVTLVFDNQKNGKKPKQKKGNDDGWEQGRGREESTDSATKTREKGGKTNGTFLHSHNNSQKILWVK